MSYFGRSKPTLMHRAVQLTVCTALAWNFWPEPGDPDWRRYAFYLFLALSIASVFLVLEQAVRHGRNIYRRAKALGKSDKAGSAGFITPRQIRKAKLHRPNGDFLGIAHGMPLFHQNETHSFTLAPAGAGKTVCTVMPALLHNPVSTLAIDLKGTLACMTADARARRHGNQVRILNPAGLWNDRLPASDTYNPLQIVIDDLTYAKADAVSDARAIALQLHAEPADAGSNKFFRDGARKILTFVILWLCFANKPGKANLAEALRLISNPDLMDEAFLLASESHALGGDIADLANDLAELAHGANSKIYEDFRQGAILSLSPFSKSGHLAANTASCSFRFSDLKGRQPVTVYIITDPTRMPVYAPWVGLISWAAITELTRCFNNKKVRFLFDEATNFKVEGLPNMLTGLREFGCSVDMVFQELAEAQRVYGTPALKTILSQTSRKQFYGVTSLETAELITMLLGKTTVTQESTSLGLDPWDDAGLSTSSTQRDLMTPDEVRRLPKDEQIIIIDNLRPIRAKKVGYQEVRPWAHWAGRNPLFPNKRFVAKPKMVLRYG